MKKVFLTVVVFIFSFGFLLAQCPLGYTSGTMPDFSKKSGVKKDSVSQPKVVVAGTGMKGGQNPNQQDTVVVAPLHVNSKEQEAVKKKKFKSK